MKIVVIGGTGLIGKQLVPLLRQQGHEVIAASPSSGVNAVTGEGLDGVLAGTDVVVDVANSPSFADADVMAFFEQSSRNLAAAEKKAGVKHHVALSIVGVDRPLINGYFRAKLAQEKLIKESGIPWTVVRATQFIEFIGAIGQSSVVGEEIRLAPVAFQPVASADVAAALAEVTLAAARNGIVELAGPEKFRFDQIVARALDAAGDKRTVVSDPQAPYFGAVVDDASLVPQGSARLGKISYMEWSKQ